ncbi:MAG: hypothetical protein JRI55_19580 [Deltaproteobacteria bacterium]|nr:hypothetical protein [Deltaproteobacteria bacterium]
MKALARHPARRFGSARQMAAAIEQVLDQPGRKRARRRAIGSSVAAGVMAFAVVLLGIQLAPVVRDLPAEMLWGSTPAEGQAAPPAAWPLDEAAPRPQLLAPSPAEPVEEAPLEIEPELEEPSDPTPPAAPQPPREPVHVRVEPPGVPALELSVEPSAELPKPVVLAVEPDDPDEE